MPAPYRSVTGFGHILLRSVTLCFHHKRETDTKNAKRKKTRTTKKGHDEKSHNAKGHKRSKGGWSGAPCGGFRAIGHGRKGVSRVANGWPLLPWAPGALGIQDNILYDRPARPPSWFRGWRYLKSRGICLLCGIFAECEGAWELHP